MICLEYWLNDGLDDLNVGQSNECNDKQFKPRIYKNINRHTNKRFVWNKHN